jgi:hypothetical protein
MYMAYCQQKPFHCAMAQGVLPCSFGEVHNLTQK